MGSTEKYIIDRYEDGDWAVLEREDGMAFHVPSLWLPDAAGEGDVLRLTTESGGEESSLSFLVDRKASQQRREDIKKLRDSLLKGPGGDIEL